MESLELVNGGTIYICKDERGVTITYGGFGFQLMPCEMEWMAETLTALANEGGHGIENT